MKRREDGDALCKSRHARHIQDVANQVCNGVWRACKLTTAVPKQGPYIYLNRPQHLMDGLCPSLAAAVLDEADEKLIQTAGWRSD